MSEAVKRVTNFRKRWLGADYNLRLFLLGVFLLGINNGILNTAFNNYLSDTFQLTANGRGLLEMPRELPGFLLIAITGLLGFMTTRSWAMFVGLLSAVGVIGMAYFSPYVPVMLVWMFCWSMADHLFMPVESTIGLSLASEGKEGRRLGQISGMRYLAAIFGAGLVWLLAHYLKSSLYQYLFTIAAIAAMLSILFFRLMKFNKTAEDARKRFVFKRKYGIFYWLNILFGARKQIFLTFGPWVLITVFKSNADVIAILMIIASILGVFFRQVFGIFVDRFGEKKMFIVDALVLMVICGGYALSKNVYILYTLFILDNLMFATRIARTTYLKKIADDPGDISATISLGITMDHLVSMTIPAIGGLIWAAFGYQAVFWSAFVIAFAVLFVTAQIRDDKPEKEAGI